MNYVHKKRELLKKTGPQKDKLLNQILQEIYDENNAIHNTLPKNKVQSSPKRASLAKKIENIVIALLAILIIFALFYPEYTTETTEHNNTKETKPSISKIHQSTVENQIAPNTEKEASNKEIKSKKPVDMIISKETKSNKKEKKVLKIKDTKTQREKAKERLMEQMRN